MGIEFKPKTPTAQDDFDVLENGEVIGTFYWNRHKPKIGDKVATVRDLEGNVAICPNEAAAVAWLKKIPSNEIVLVQVLQDMLQSISTNNLDKLNQVITFALSFLSDRYGVNLDESDQATSNESSQGSGESSARV